MAGRVLKARDVRLHVDWAGAAGGADLAAARAAREAELAESYERGWREGTAVAEETGAAAVPRLIAAIEAATVRTTAAVEAQHTGHTTDLVETAMTIATWLVDERVARDVDALRSRIATALGDLLPTPPVVIKVAPRAVDALAEFAGPEVEVVGDPALRLGEATIVAGHGDADLTYAEARRRLLGELGMISDDEDRP